MSMTADTGETSNHRVLRDIKQLNLILLRNGRSRWYRGKHNTKLKPRHQCLPDHSGTNPVVVYIFGVPIKMHVYTDT